jgi:phosphoglycolate phosphatase
VAYPALVLFDIDGTLVRRAGPHHREALVEGVRRITGLDTTTEGIPVQGMLDPDIITLMLLRCGLSSRVIRRSLPDIERAAERTISASARKSRTATALRWNPSSTG